MKYRSDFKKYCKSEVETFTEAQQTQGIESLTCISFSTEFAFFLAAEITQLKDSMPWVRCTSGNVF